MRDLLSWIHQKYLITNTMPFMTTYLNLIETDFPPSLQSVLWISFTFSWSYWNQPYFLHLFQNSLQSEQVCNTILRRKKWINYNRVTESTRNSWSTQASHPRVTLDPRRREQLKYRSLWKVCHKRHYKVRVLILLGQKRTHSNPTKKIIEKKDK